MTRQYSKQLYNQSDVGVNISVRIIVTKESDDYGISTSIRDVGHKYPNKEYQPYRLTCEMSKSKDGGWCSVLLWRKCFGIERYRDHINKIR